VSARMAPPMNEAASAYHLGLRVVDFQCRVLASDLRWLWSVGPVEARNHLDHIPPECRRDGARSSGRDARARTPGIGREKRKLRGNTPITFWERCLRESAFQSRWIGVVSFPPNGSGKNGNVVGFGSGFSSVKYVRSRGQPQSREKIRRTRAWSGGFPSSRLATISVP